MKSGGLPTYFLAAGLSVGCAKTSVVPALDSSRIVTTGISDVVRRSVRVRIVDERFISPKDKQKSVENVSHALSVALLHAGVPVDPSAVDELSLRCSENDEPVADFSTNECVRIDATYRGLHVRVEATGIGCAHRNGFFGMPVAGDATMMFEPALNMALQQIVRMLQHGVPRGSSDVIDHVVQG